MDKTWTTYGGRTYYKEKKDALANKRGKVRFTMTLMRKLGT